MKELCNGTCFIEIQVFQTIQEIVNQLNKFIKFNHLLHFFNKTSNPRQAAKVLPRFFDQMLAVMAFSQHLVLSSKTVKP